jgi:hypothetical protein
MRMRTLLWLPVLAVFFTAAAAVADTPTPTPEATPTITPTATPPNTPVPIAMVHINHNRFNPAAGESVQVTGLRTEHGKVTIQVFTPDGKRVRNLAEGQELGGTTPAWDGRNEQGETVASGVYVVVVSGTKLHKRFRIAVLK